MSTTGAPIGNQNGRKSGLYTLKRTISELGGRVIDKRYRTGKALAKWQAELVSDLGGDLSTQQKVLVDLCVRSKLILDSIDVWLLSQKTLVSYRKRALIPVVKDRQAIADGLTRNLQLLGLERKAKPVSWESYLEDIRDETKQEPQAPEYPTAVDPGDVLKDRKAEAVGDGEPENRE